MRMVCKSGNRYGGKKNGFGDEVEIPERDVKVVTALGWFVPIKNLKAPAEKAAPKTQARALALGPGERAPELPEDQPPEPTWAGVDLSVKPPDDEAKPKREYKRRDLKAEP